MEQDSEKTIGTYFKDMDRRKYFFERELLLKGMIYEEKVLEEEFKETEKVIDKIFIKNHTHSVYHELFDSHNDTESTDLDFLCNKSKIDSELYDKVLRSDERFLRRIASSNDFSEVFIERFSVIKNLDVVHEYHKILKEELVEVKKNLGLYKSSWGYLDSIQESLKTLNENVEFLKKNQLFENHLELKVHLVVRFIPYKTEIEAQHFKIEVLKSSEEDQSEFTNGRLSSQECLKLLQLKDWGTFVSDEVESFIELRKDGIDPGKQNHKLIKNDPEEMDIDYDQLDVN